MTKIRLCPTGKFAYATFLSAESALRGFKEQPDERHRHRHAPKRPYRCPRCGMYHLTSQEKRGRS